MRAARGLLVALREDLRGLLAPGSLDAGSELRADPPAERPAVDWRWGLGASLALLAFAAYLWVGWLTTGTELLRGYNIAFDLDAPRFVLLFAQDRALWDEGTHALDYRIKHPFLLALRLPGLALAGLGLSPQMAAVTMLALAGALTVACAWAWLRLLALGLAESVLLTVFFAGSCAQLVYATIVESYGFAALTLAFVYLAALLRMRGRWSHARGRFVTALVTFGVTSSNVALAGLAEAAVWARRLAPGRALLRSVSYGVVLSALAALGVVAAYPSAAPLVANPVEGVKRVQWIGVLEDREIEKGGPWRELVTFAGYGFVAPGLTEVQVEGGAKTMVDFRAPTWSPLGRVALGLWLALLVAGAASLLRGGEGRVLLGLFVACLLFNMALHLVFQYRGSLFIVASHAHFPLFACAAAAAARTSRAARGQRLAALAGLGVLTALTLLENGRRMADLLAYFAL